MQVKVSHFSSDLTHINVYFFSCHAAANCAVTSGPLYSRWGQLNLGGFHHFQKHAWSRPKKETPLILSNIVVQILAWSPLYLVWHFMLPCAQIAVVEPQLLLLRTKRLEAHRALSAPNTLKKPVLDPNLYLWYSSCLCLENLKILYSGSRALNKTWLNMIDAKKVVLRTWINWEHDKESQSTTVKSV